MGIGKNKKCKCKKCEATKTADKAYKQLVEIYMECGCNLWKERCYNWGLYKDINEIVTPNVQKVSSNSGGEGCSEEAWESHWVRGEEQSSETTAEEACVRCR